MRETVLLSVRQHVVKYFFRLPRWILGACIVAFVVLFFGIPQLVAIIAGVWILFVGLYLEWLRYSKSALRITNLRVYLSVMKGIARAFEAGLHYRQIKNCTFRQEHIIHTLTNSGTLYLRTGPTDQEQIVAGYVPNVDRVCHIVNWLLALPEEQRMELETLPETAKPPAPKRIL